jgi:hypothetical protein
MNWINNKPVKNSKVLYFRIVVYVLVALYCSRLIGNHYGDNGLVVGVAIGIVIILTLFAISALFIRQYLDWIRKHLGLLLGIYTFLQLLLIFWNHFKKN